jgi:hypothetical protein
MSVPGSPSSAQAVVFAQSGYGRLVKRTDSALAMGCSPDNRYGRRRRG